MVLERAMVWPDGWMASEIVSEEGLHAVGTLFDLDASAWWSDIASGQQRLFVVAQVGGPLARQMVVKLRSHGSAWTADTLMHSSMAAVTNPAYLQRVNELAARMTQLENA